jgi:xanthine dehydrogenase accessory factor
VSFFARLAELERERACFAVATVVARRAPVSSHLGDRALVFADGSMDGFIGGSCSRDIVRREALRALRSGQPRLVQIAPGAPAPDPANAQPDAGDAARLHAASDDCVVVAMGCASEGAVDVYIEPHLPLPRLIVVGDTPVADALARVAAQIRYDVVRVVLAGEIDNLAPVAGVRPIALESLATHLADAGSDACAQLVAVVASQGHYDEEALAPLLAAQPAFVGLLASRRRARAVSAVLAQQGVTPESLATLCTPVGLDIGARGPGDVAIAILAEIIQTNAAASTTPAIVSPEVNAHVHNQAGNSGASTTVDQGTTEATAIDPVCGMEVDIATARHRFEHGGRTYVFCGASCRAAFAADPVRA